MAALVTEVSCYAAVVAYGTRQGYAPTVWGSDAACYVQDALVVATISFFRKFPLLKVSILASAWLALQALLFSDAMPLWLLAKFQVRPGGASTWSVANFREMRLQSCNCLMMIFCAAC